jgi:hypothetical protein
LEGDGVGFFQASEKRPISWYGLVLSEAFGSAGELEVVICGGAVVEVSAGIRLKIQGLSAQGSGGLTAG